METCSEKRQKTSNAFLSGFHALRRNPPTRILRDGSQDFKAKPASEDSGNQGMAKTGQQASPAQRLVASPESQTHRTLQLFWHQWQHPLSEAILLPSEKRGVQMDESQESANQHDSGEIPAISGMASPTDPEILPPPEHITAKRGNAYLRGVFWESHKTGLTGAKRQPNLKVFKEL